MERKRIVRKSRPGVNEEVKALDALLKSISEDQELVAAAEMRLKENLVAATALMKTLKLDREVVVVDDVVAVVGEMVTKVGRVSKDIDPAKFRKLVSDDKAFFGCVKVLSEPAKKVLSGKELDSITTVTPGKTGEPELKVTTTRG